MARLISEETVCQMLKLEPARLRRWIEHGLVHARSLGDQPGFEPNEVRRIWSIVSLHDDLELNLEAVGAILDLAEEVRALRGALARAVRQLEQTRRLDRFHRGIIQEHLGGDEWEIEL